MAFKPEQCMFKVQANPVVNQREEARRHTCKASHGA